MTWLTGATRLRIRAIRVPVSDLVNSYILPPKESQVYFTPSRLRCKYFRFTSGGCLFQTVWFGGHSLVVSLMNAVSGPTEAKFMKCLLLSHTGFLFYTEIDIDCCYSQTQLFTATFHKKTSSTTLCTRQTGNLCKIHPF